MLSYSLEASSLNNIPLLISPICHLPPLVFSIFQMKPSCFPCINLEWAPYQYLPHLHYKPLLRTPFYHSTYILWYEGWVLDVGGCLPFTVADSALLFASPPSNIFSLSLSSPTETAYIFWLSKAFIYFYAEFGQSLPQWTLSLDSLSSCELLEYKQRIRF